MHLKWFAQPITPGMHCLGTINGHRLYVDSDNTDQAWSRRQDKFIMNGQRETRIYSKQKRRCRRGDCPVRHGCVEACLNASGDGRSDRPGNLVVSVIISLGIRIYFIRWFRNITLTRVLCVYLFSCVFYVYICSNVCFICVFILIIVLINITFICVF